MSEPKTKPNRASVAAFIKSVEPPDKRADCRELMKLIKELTGNRPKMWGNSIVGYGSYHYKYATGREGDWFVVGFAPRKQNLTLYVMSGFARHEGLMKKLGKYKTGKSCLYVKRLDDIDRCVLRQLITRSIQQLEKAGADYGCC